MICFIASQGWSSTSNIPGWWSITPAFVNLGLSQMFLRWQLKLSLDLTWSCLRTCKVLKVAIAIRTGETSRPRRVLLHELYLEWQWANYPSVLVLGLGRTSEVSSSRTIFFLLYKHALCSTMKSVGLLESLSPLHILAFLWIYILKSSKKQWSRHFQADLLLSNEQRHHLQGMQVPIPKTANLGTVLE